MNHRNDCPVEHEFILVLDGVLDLTEEMENALFESGCGDATISTRSGRVFMTFARTAPSLREAILSAIRDVLNAKVGASVLCVDNCNLVTPSEIARRIGRSRQLVHQYMTGERGPGSFPPAACDLTDDKPFWHWCDVSHWLWQNNIVPEKVVREAQDVASINSVLSLIHQRQWDAELIANVFRVVEGPQSACPV